MGGVVDPVAALTRNRLNLEECERRALTLRRHRVQLVRAALEAGVRKAEVARLLGIRPQSVDRYRDGRVA